jgi:holliday junction DNA helicase RuvA
VIAFVSGRVAQVGLSSAVLDVGGVGLELLCTPGTLARLRDDATATLPTSLVVREDSLTLFGFIDEDEKTVFELLQTASGVGPKLAQAMLAVHSPEELRRAVTQEDVRALTQVPGIGQKGAQRIILELKDRIGAPSTAGAPPVSRSAVPGEPEWRVQVREALVGLGWSVKEAEKGIDVAVPDPDQVPEMSTVLRMALRAMSRG